MRHLALVALLILAAGVSAQTLLIDHAPVTMAAGTREFTGNFPDAVTRVTLRIAKYTDTTPQFWADPATTVQFQSYISVDNGSTWIDWVGCGGSGGPHVRRDGTQAPEMTCTTTTPLPPRREVQRRFRAILTVTGPDLVTEATLEVQ